MAFDPLDQCASPTSTRAPGILLGVGLGGFVDGIVLHQILQWHHVLTATDDNPMTTVRGLERNTFADGIFHSLTWVLVVVGLGLWLRAWQNGELAGGMRRELGLALAGWGIFNLVEGTLSHHLLTLHHVRDDVADPLWWDLGFLASGLVLVALGTVLARSSAPPSAQGRFTDRPVTQSVQGGAAAVPDHTEVVTDRERRA